MSVSCAAISAISSGVKTKSARGKRPGPAWHCVRQRSRRSQSGCAMSTPGSLADRLPPVNLVQVDHVCVEPAQALVTLAANGIGVERIVHLALVIPNHVTLCKNIRLRSRPIRQGFGDDRFRMSGTENRGSVDPVDSKF